LTVDKIRGQQVDVRHILLTPKVDPQQLEESKKTLDSIRKRIIDEEFTFKNAAYNFSDDKKTRNSGGVLINPVTGDTRFELTKMDPVLYNQVNKLKEGEISLPLLEEDRSGSKKYKIIKISNRYEEHVADYSQDYIRIKELALKDKQLKAITKWTKEKIEDTYVSISKDYKNCEFSNNWLKK
jgi:peptidyl-prolyl cis-trans isomerase SurA